VGKDAFSNPGYTTLALGSKTPNDTESTPETAMCSRKHCSAGFRMAAPASWLKIVITMISLSHGVDVLTAIRPETAARGSARSNEFSTA
jgi:hypothetical protein